MSDDDNNRAPIEEPAPTLEELIEFIEAHGGRLGPLRGRPLVPLEELAE
jgi:hypothetical protein